jgi:PTS system nitrogen regulatory IIA component
MAIVTAMLSGPFMRLILRGEKKSDLRNLLSSKLFLRELGATARRGVIREMTAAACAVAGLDADSVEKAVWDREEALSTGIGNGVAIPHARLEGLRESLVAVGISKRGVDFDSPDGKLAEVIFLVLTPGDAPGDQLQIAAEIARLFRDPRMAGRVLRTQNFTDFLALIRTGV